MVGYDRNGRSSSTNFLYGGGVVKASLLDANNTPIGNWREFGCVDELTINLANQTIEKFCSRTGPNVRAALDVSQVSGDVSMVLAELKFENLALFGLGEIRDHTVASVSDTGIPIYVPNPSYTGTSADKDPIGRSYDLHTNGTVIEGGSPGGSFVFTLDNRIPSTSGDTFAMTTVAIPGQSGGPYTVNSTQGVEYDPEIAEFYIAGEDLLDDDFEADLLAAGAAAPSSRWIELTVTATGGVAAATRDQVVLLTESSQAIAVRYEGHNVRTGDRVIVEMPRVSLFPNGTWNVINPQDYGTLPMSGSLESNSAYTSGSNGGYFRVIKL